MKRDCTGKFFKPITNFYCYNCHGFGHKAIDCKKPKFVDDNKNSKMFKDTNPMGNKRSRSNDGEKHDDEKKKFDELRTTEKVEEPKQDESSKGMYFKRITNLYCYNYHVYGHKVEECKKPNFIDDNKNSRMFRNTNPIGNGKIRS